MTTLVTPHNIILCRNLVGNILTTCNSIAPVSRRQRQANRMCHHASADALYRATSTLPRSVTLSAVLGLVWPHRSIKERSPSGVITSRRYQARTHGKRTRGCRAHDMQASAASLACCVIAAQLAGVQPCAPAVAGLIGVQLIGCLDHWPRWTDRDVTSIGDLRPFRTLPRSDAPISAL